MTAKSNNENFSHYNYNKNNYSQAKPSRKPYIKPDFRITGNEFFFTWPRTGLHLQEVLKQIQEKLKPPFSVNEYQIVEYMICMEFHRDYETLDIPCGTHLHMYMKIKNMTTASPLNCHDCSRFDLEDPTLLVDGKPKVYHGQYALAKNKTKLIQYLPKEGLHINQSITSGGLIFEMIVKTLEKEEILKKYGATTYMAFLLQTELKSVVNTFSKQLNNAKTRFKFYQNDTSSSGA